MRQWCSRRLLSRVLRADEALVSLPPNVGTCAVYRNVLTMEEEEIIYEELSRVLQKEGQPSPLEGSAPAEQLIKHTYLEMFGTEKEWTEVRNWQKKEVRRLPGLMWTPTLLRILRDIAPSLLGDLPDTARVVEHQFPGYEMHVEHPTVGCSFLYFNLLSDTVLDFDDESTNRQGQVFLPSRSLLHVSGEARWGFRFGERAEEVHTFTLSNGTRRVVDTDMRLSIQLWKLNANLLDGRLLQERIEDSIEMVSKRMAEEAAAKRTAKQDEEEALEALQLPGNDIPSFAGIATSPNPMESFVVAAMEQSSKRGPLGGDLTQASGASDSTSTESPTMGDIQGDYGRHKKQFANVYGILQDMKAMQDAGQPMNDLWLTKKMREGASVNDEKDRREGFDPQDIEGTWDKVDAKARFYKAKLKTMDYDGTAFLNSTMPDVSQETPLDMRSTIRKIAPYVKDGEKLLSSLPQAR